MSAVIEALESLLLEATDSHASDCPVVANGESALNCDCGAQTNGGELVEAMWAMLEQLTNEGGPQ